MLIIFAFAIIYALVGSLIDDRTPKNICKISPFILSLVHSITSVSLSICILSTYNVSISNISTNIYLTNVTDESEIAIQIISGFLVWKLIDISMNGRGIANLIHTIIVCTIYIAIGSMYNKYHVLLCIYCIVTEISNIPLNIYLICDWMQANAEIYSKSCLYICIKSLAYNLCIILWPTIRLLYQGSLIMSIDTDTLAKNMYLRTIVCLMQLAYVLDIYLTIICVL